MVMSDFLHRHEPSFGRKANEIPAGLDQQGGCVVKCIEVLMSGVGSGDSVFSERAVSGLLR